MDQLSKIRDLLYRSHRKYMYYLRKNRDQLEKQNHVFIQKMQRFMVLSEKASTTAMGVGLSLEQVYRIEQRAFFDAVLQLSQEGDLPYKEYFVRVERADVPGEYDIVSEQGDLPQDFQVGYTYTTLQLTQWEALVHVYYREPMENTEVTQVVLAMAAGGSLGNYGAVIYQEGEIDGNAE